MGQVLGSPTLLPHIAAVSLRPTVTIPFRQTNCSNFKDAAPDVISEVLAGGFEGGEIAERQRAEAAEAAHEILEEVRLLLRTSPGIFQRTTTYAQKI